MDEFLDGDIELRERARAVLAAESAEPGAADAEPGIARMLAGASSPASASHLDVSHALRAALHELDAADAAGRAETSDDDEAFDVHAARQDAADEKVLAVPCRSLADVGAKLTCLIPRIRPDLLNKRHAEHLDAMRSDIERMLMSDGVAGADPILAVIEVWRERDAALTSFDAQVSAGTFVGNKVEEEERLIEARAPVRDAVLATVPITPAGRAALVRFLRAEIAASGTIEGEPPDDDHPIWRDGLRALLAAQEAEIRAATASRSAGDDLIVTLGARFCAAAQRQTVAVNAQEDEAADVLGEEAKTLARRIIALPAFTLDGAHAKLRIAAFYGTCDPDLEHDDNYPGEAAIRSLYRDVPGIEISTNPADIRIVADAAAMSAAEDRPQTEPLLSDQIIACWREWAFCQGPDETDIERKAWERISDRRYALLNAALALPPTMANLPAKALALAWLEYPQQWERGRERKDYGIDGGLAVDIDTAIVDRFRLCGHFRWA